MYDVIIMSLNNLIPLLNYLNLKKNAIRLQKNILKVIMRNKFISLKIFIIHMHIN